ncbi:MAG: hypothetical protein HY775_10955 [Acidobacteria bacterium]|nr:hypothetical protein [Acidobacteriota bacterium]
MITDINSEDRLAQQTFADHLRNRLGRESICADNAESSGRKKRLAVRRSAMWCWCGISGRCRRA